VIGHALVGWVLCAGTIGIAQAVWTLDTALVLHAIGAPIYFLAVSRHYFRRYRYTTPLQTAGAFIGFVMTIDFFVIGLVVNRKLEMFTSARDLAPVRVDLHLHMAHRTSHRARLGRRGCNTTRTAGRGMSPAVVSTR
jgi:hypothetical protein